MEDQLKARLIGASVLVLLAVLLIPELLSARKPAADAIGCRENIAWHAHLYDQSR